MLLLCRPRHRQLSLSDSLSVSPPPARAFPNCWLVLEFFCCVPQVREKGVGEDKIDAALETKNPKKALIRLLDQN